MMLDTLDVDAESQVERDSFSISLSIDSPTVAKQFRFRSDRSDAQSDPASRIVLRNSALARTYRMRKETKMYIELAIR